MIFTLEALNAKNGDALILHYGAADAPRFILIDGGPTKGGYRRVIRPRLNEIKARFKPGLHDALPLEMMMVSHIDDDHIDGLLALTADLLTLKESGDPLPYAVRTLWFNSFDELLGNDDEEIFSELTARVRAAGVGAPLPGFSAPDIYGAAVVASVGQGRRLRKDAEGLTIPLNAPFSGLILSGESGARTLDFGQDLRFTILAPSEARVRELQRIWREDLEENPSAETLAETAAAGGRDTSVANLSSIVVLAEVGGKRMLLTGDGLDTDILEGLEIAGLLDGDGKIHVDILKLPHHGSDRNVSEDFFSKVTADHYVASGDGRHGNPEIHTLEMIEASRAADADYKIHLTYRDGKEDFGERLDAHLDETNEDRYVFRADGALSLKVDLLDPVTY